MNKAKISPMMKRLSPIFELAVSGYTSLSVMFKAFDAVAELRKGENDQQVRLR